MAVAHRQRSRQTTAELALNRDLPQPKSGPWKADRGGTIPFTSTLKKVRSSTATACGHHRQKVAVRTYTVCVTMGRNHQDAIPGLGWHVHGALPQHHA